MMLEVRDSIQKWPLKLIEAYARNFDFIQLVCDLLVPTDQLYKCFCWFYCVPCNSGYASLTCNSGPLEIDNVNMVVKKTAPINSKHNLKYYTVVLIFAAWNIPTLECEKGGARLAGALFALTEAITKEWVQEQPRYKWSSHDLARSIPSKTNREWTSGPSMERSHQYLLKATEKMTGIKLKVQLA